MSIGELPAATLHQDELEQLGEIFNRQELEKLMSVRQRQRLQSGEEVIYTAPTKNQQEDELPVSPFADLDGFQFNGQGSAPPLSYYKTVSF